MKANIKRYTKANPILLAPLNVNMIDLLKANHLALHEIGIVNVHNYLISLDQIMKVKIHQCTVSLSSPNKL